MKPSHELPDGSVLFFPEGLPGFEDRQHFILLQHGDYVPLLLLRDAADEKVSLPVVPVQFVDPTYELVVPTNDCQLLGFPASPKLSDDVLCLLVLVLAGQGQAPKCNLFAPIVVNPASMRAKQIMQIGSAYPSVFLLPEG